ncbi:p53 and DNA damage-regulated protein 1-like [Anoplophora glabripennis]|uniref:p53 and DNA damage-regulated protein 1-like n=1 Tax=Anoplophora glabripennis TaxID=217634 RepID=UPI000C78CAAD|nr:p53 and DNA damage-regulated protein 1-like [Anoplophora glabripennis]
MAALQDLQTQKSYKYLHEVETLAQEILTAKETKMQIANAQNKFREALRAIESTEERRTWIQMGTVYIERPSSECKNILRSEIAKAEEDLDNLHKKIKEMVYKLRDLEHEPRLEGFTLKPISVAEAKALHKGFGLID